MLNLFPIHTVHKKDSTKQWSTLIKALATLIVLVAMCPTQGWNKIAEGQLTTGSQGSFYGYSAQHATPFGSLNQTLQDSAPVPNNGNLNNIRFIHYDDNYVYLGLPEASANADSLFQVMAISYNDKVQAYARKDAVQSRAAINGSYVQQWRWPDGHNPAPRTANETVTIEFSRPAGNFGGNYRASVTSGDNWAGGTGYDAITNSTYGNLAVSDADPEQADQNDPDYSVDNHVGTVKGIYRRTGSFYLYLEPGTSMTSKNSDKVFTVMRLTQDVSTAQDGSDIRYWDFKRNEATFSTRYSMSAFKWNRDIEAIPGVARVFTLELRDSAPTTQSCTWIREWNDCDNVTKTQTLTPISNVSGCTPAAPKPPTETHNCAVCEIRDMNNDGNLGCFHRHEQNQDRIPQIQSSLTHPRGFLQSNLKAKDRTTPMDVRQEPATGKKSSIWLNRLLRLLPIGPASAQTLPEKQLTIIRRFHVLDGTEKQAIVVQTDANASPATRAIPVLNENNVSSLLKVNYINVCRHPCRIEQKVPDSKPLSTRLNEAYLAQTQMCENAPAFTDSIDNIKAMCPSDEGAGSSGAVGPCTGWTCDAWNPDAAETCPTETVTQTRNCGIKTPPGCYGTPAAPQPADPTSRTVPGTKQCGPVSCTGWDTSDPWSGPDPGTVCQGSTATQTRTVTPIPVGCTDTTGIQLKPAETRDLAGTKTGGSCGGRTCHKWSCESWSPGASGYCTTQAVDQTRTCSRVPGPCPSTPTRPEPEQSRTVAGTQSCNNCTPGSWSSWSPSTSSKCSGTTFTQTRSRTDSCGVTSYDTRTATGTKTTGNCGSQQTCTWGSWNSWAPSTGSQTCGTSFTQTRSRTDNCGNRDNQSRATTGSKKGSWSTGAWGACSANCSSACPSSRVNGTKTRNVTCSSACGCGGTKPSTSVACSVSGCKSQGTYSYGSCNARASSVCVGQVASGSQSGSCSNSCGCTGAPSKPCSVSGTKTDGHCDPTPPCRFTTTPASCGSCNKCSNQTCTAQGTVVNLGPPRCSGGTRPSVPTRSCPGTKPAGTWSCTAYSGSPGSCTAPSSYTVTRTCTCNGGCCGAKPPTSTSRTCPSGCTTACRPVGPGLARYWQTFCPGQGWTVTGGLC